MPSQLRIVTSCVAIGIAASSPAGVTSVGPFAGQYHENSNQHSSNMAVQVLPVFDGLGTLENLSEGGAIKVEWSSSLSGDLVSPLSGMMCGQLGIAQWVFDEPVCRFGGWFENNSGADDATLEFYDVNDQLIGVMIAETAADAQSWTWNGWESDVPFSRIVVTGNGIVNGFLWYENMELDLATPCVTDIDGDGMTGVEDLIAVILAWGTADADADVDGSGQVNVDDLVEVVLAWGPCQ
jgi:hypothetical protein